MKLKSTKPILTQKVLDARIRKAAPAMLGALDAIRALSGGFGVPPNPITALPEINHIAHRAIAQAQGSNPFHGTASNREPGLPPSVLLAECAGFIQDFILTGAEGVRDKYPRPQDLVDRARLALGKAIK